ncbi:acyl carrier protein [Tsuneonella mangrovi]|uniref:acyl carrier protein n=1 Tax=Tsuneonella mangrovi TaxID=1982042 RepID=UPI001F0B3BC5|nr:acyl carrier protein [Tsuneonella mangrovi]
MTRADIIDRLTGIIEDVFDLDVFEYRDGLSAADIEEWDSLSNIRFMVAVETAFAIRFTNSQIEGLRNIGEMVDLVQTKLG